MHSIRLDTLLLTPLRLEIREKTWALDTVCEVASNLAPTFNATVERAAYRIKSYGVTAAMFHVSSDEQKN